jgi:hypothetical protein
VTGRSTYTQFRLKIPAGGAERTVAEALVQRGHRWVIVNDGVVASLCVNPPTESDDGEDGSAFSWQDCEMAAVKQLLRDHGGYVGSCVEGAGPNPQDRFLRDGRTPAFELDEPTALARRHAAIAAFPVRSPEPPAAPLFDAETPRRAPAFIEVLRAASQRIYGDPHAALRLAGMAGPGDASISAFDYLGALQNEVMHQGSCYPDTVEAVPLLVALATHEHVYDSERAYAMEFLFAGASYGPRSLSRCADQAAALGEEFGESDGARLTREAVQAHGGTLFARWDQEVGPVRMALAALAAALPEQAAAASVLPALAEFAGRWPGTKRAAALGLALAAARGDDEATLAEISAIEAWHWQGPLAGGSPLAEPRARALCLLEDPEVRD